MEKGNTEEDSLISDNKARNKAERVKPRKKSGWKGRE